MKIWDTDSYRFTSIISSTPHYFSQNLYKQLYQNLSKHTFYDVMGNINDFLKKYTQNSNDIVSRIKIAVFKVIAKKHHCRRK